MSTTEIRQKLFDYIRDAEDGKVKAIYTMVENEINIENNIWTDEFLSEMNQRVQEFEEGKDTGSSWEQVKERVKGNRNPSNL